MVKNKIIIANMKMNLTLTEIKKYIEKMKDYHKDFIICPSYLYASYFIDAGYNVGVQNISEYGLGPYTGEISINQIISMNMKYVIIGHSERRELFSETDEMISHKLRKTISNKVSAILCVGETIDDKNNNQVKAKIRSQLLSALDNIDTNFADNLIIAYEPVWSIGTGNLPTIQEITDIIDYIKQLINAEYGFIPKVLYGGSTNDKNIEQLNTINNIDGFLIGGSCLIPEKFVKIIETVC